MKIDEQVRRMSPARYTRGQAARLIGKDPDTLRRWKRTKVFIPSEQTCFGKLTVDLYTEDDITELRVIAKGMKPGRKPE